MGQITVRKSNPLHPFFFLSSTISTLSSGTSLYVSNMYSSISALTSPCTVISSPPPGIFVTLLPVANFLPNSLATFFRSSPKASSPETAVTYFRLLRSMRLMRTLEEARFSASRSSLASAFAAFFAASFSERSWTFTERVLRFWASASNLGW